MKRRDAAERETRRTREREIDLVRDAAHELRTPITIARGHAELIASSGSSGCAADAEIVLDELVHLSSATNHLLLLAAADHPDFLHIQSVDAHAFALNIVTRWQTPTSGNIELGSAADGSFPGDHDRLMAAVDALIENASRHSPPGGRIELSCVESKRGIEIRVSNPGDCIPESELRRIFDRFYRTSVQPGRARGGTGLGLAIVRAIAEAHGGSASGASSPSTGTTISIWLPGFRAATVAEPLADAVGAAA